MTSRTQHAFTTLSLTFAVALGLCGSAFAGSSEETRHNAYELAVELGQAEHATVAGQSGRAGPVLDGWTVEETRHSVYHVAQAYEADGGERMGGHASATPDGMTAPTSVETAHSLHDLATEVAVMR